MLRTLLVLLALAWLSHGNAVARQNCDPNLKVDRNDPLGYGPRGDRCEGVFLDKVSGTIRIASLHFPKGDFEPRVGTTARLEWSLPPASQVQVQAVSLRPRLFYRMDAVRPGIATFYGWPTDFAARVQLKSNEIGFLSWADVKIGSRTEQVFSPISLGGRSGETQIVLVPEAQLAELYYSLIKLDAQGRAEASIVSDQPLKRGTYPAGQPVTIRLPALESQRIYRLEIAAPQKNGGSITRDVYLADYR